MVLEFKSWLSYLSLCDDAGQAKILRSQSEKHVANTTKAALHPMCNLQGGSHSFSNPNRIRNLHVDKDPDTLDVFFPKAKAISFSWFWSMGACAAEIARKLYTR